MSVSRSYHENLSQENVLASVVSRVVYFAECSGKQCSFPVIAVMSVSGLC